ncbi:MAG: amidohydrolase family protein [Lachnospiraceae bacterium]|nr:amidohydrolase family protein [Lachnospiraceae bacterium]
MIIDIHTHIFTDSLAPRAKQALLEAAHGEYTPLHDMTRASLLEYMDKAGVDISVVQPIVTKRHQFEKINEWAISLTSDRLISFAGMWPHTDDWKEQIDIISSMGFKGIKYHCEYQDFVIDDKKMLPIYDYAFSKGLILLFHAGYDPAFKAPFRSNPEKFASIARELKGGIIIAAHLGGCRQWDSVAQNYAGLDNMYIDTSMGMKDYPHETFLEIVNAIGADHVLFGSDSPWSDAVEEIRILNSLPLSDEQKELILSGNARRLLNIQ